MGMSEVWALRLAGTTQEAEELARKVFTGEARITVESVVRDVRWAPVMGKRGYAVRALRRGICGPCGGTGEGENGPCPVCGGRGLIKWEVEDV